ncbi:MAG TPA: FliH/SctL family protein [Pirellulales bacterium]
MSTVIKAASSSSDSALVAFNFDDLAMQGDAYLKKIRAHAERIVAKAAQEAVAIRQAAEAEGRQSGLDAVEKLLDDKVAARLETVLPALREAVTAIERSKQGWLAEWERQSVHLAAAMAERVCRCELRRQPEIPIGLVREALELAGANGNLRIALHPDDHAALGRQLERVVAEFSRLAATDIVADRQVTRGGCRVETEHGVIDQCFDVQLARMKEELL